MIGEHAAVVLEFVMSEVKAIYNVIQFKRRWRNECHSFGDNLDTKRIPFGKSRITIKNDSEHYYNRHLVISILVRKAIIVIGTYKKIIIPFYSY